MAKFISALAPPHMPNRAKPRLVQYLLNRLLIKLFAAMTAMKYVENGVYSETAIAAKGGIVVKQLQY